MKPTKCPARKRKGQQNEKRKGGGGGRKSEKQMSRLLCHFQTLRVPELRKLIFGSEGCEVCNL